MQCPRVENHLFPDGKIYRLLSLHVTLNCDEKNLPYMHTCIFIPSVPILQIFKYSYNGIGFFHVRLTRGSPLSGWHVPWRLKIVAHQHASVPTSESLWISVIEHVTQSVYTKMSSSYHSLVDTYNISSTHTHKRLTGPMLMQCVKLSSALICVRHSFTAQDLRYLLWILS